MSGPKVVRIVTREEIIAICQGHIARAEAALAHWMRVCERGDLATPAEVSAYTARLERLRELLATDRFNELQKAAPQEVEFLKDDTALRQDRAAAAAAAARSSARRRAQAAGSLAKALKAKGIADPELEADLERAARGDGDERAITRGFAALSAKSETDERAKRSLAQRHKDGAAELSFAEWIAQQPAQHDPTIVRLEAKLAQLAQIAEDDEVGEFERRFADAQAGADGTRGMRLDSLELDLARALKAARARRVLMTETQLLAAELTAAGLQPPLELATASSLGEAALGSLRQSMRQDLEANRAQLAAEARRAAVLQSLADLGYEVGESLATAWVEAGRVVLKKVATPDYGVEISGDPSSARMQMRAVTFSDGSGGPDSVRDRDAEAAWCGDVTALQADLNKVGGGLVIERAMEIGATPLKRVVKASANGRAQRGHANQTKSLS